MTPDLKAILARIKAKAATRREQPVVVTEEQVRAALRVLHQERLARPSSLTPLAYARYEAEVVVACSSGGLKQAEAHGVWRHCTPCDPHRFAMYLADAPLAAGLAVALSTGGGEHHLLFPAERTAAGEWAGEFYLPPGERWTELLVEPLTADRFRALAPAGREAVLAQLRSLVRDHGDDRPADDGPSYRDLWTPLLAAHPN